MGVVPPSDIIGGGGARQPPGLMFSENCKNVIGARNMLIYFRLSLYIWQGVDASKANLLNIYF